MGVSMWNAAQIQRETARMTLPLNRNKVTISPNTAKAQRYPFEGQQMTVKEVAARVTAVSESVVRDRLKEGVTTIAGMLNDNRAKAAKSAGSKRGASKSEWGKKWSAQ